MALLALLKHRPFLLLWIGQTTSRLGDGVYGIALDWWILQKTHSATAVGLVLVIAFLPRVALILVGGVFADRLPRLAIMLASDLTRGFLTLVMTIGAAANVLPFRLVVAISFCFGLTGAFFGPAYSSIFPQLLPKPLLPGANALRTLSGRIALILGPAIGAALIAIGGTPLAFAINSGSFAVSALCISLILPLLRNVATDRASAPAPQGARAVLVQFRSDFREGIETAAALPWIWLTIALATFANFFAEGITDVTIPYDVQQALHASPLLYGSLTAATSAGSLLGAIWFGGRAHRHRGWLIYGCYVAAVLMLTMIGLASFPLVMLAAMLLFGLFDTILGLAWVYALQEYVPPERLGRVSSLDQLGSYLLNPLSYVVVGALTDRWGAQVVLIGGGIISAGIFALGLLSRSVRRLD
jgi:MFS family permease